MQPAMQPRTHIELYPSVFSHPVWLSLRANCPFIYDECRATWLTCLEIWGMRRKLAPDWNGIIAKNWLRRALPECRQELAALVRFGLLEETPDGDLTMPYFPERKERSARTSLMVWKIDLSWYTFPTSTELA